MNSKNVSRLRWIAIHHANTPIGREMVMIRAIVLFFAVVLGTNIAYAGSATVTVPANTCGGFGSPVSGYVPLVNALTVYSPETIIIKYVSGTWCGSGSALCSGPNGVDWVANNVDWATPLQEGVGVTGGKVRNLMALIGAFVPDSLVKTSGFKEVDQTKLASGVGITPDKLFFVGSYNVIQVSGPGTLYLGVNDMWCVDNSGLLLVSVNSK